jgi:hypothetical protein
VNAIREGVLVLNEDKTFTHNLSLPISSGDTPIASLTYKPRLTVGAVHAAMQGVKADNADGRILAYVAALSGQPKGVIAHIDTEDYGVCQAIAIFFL